MARHGIGRDWAGDLDSVAIPYVALTATGPVSVVLAIIGAGIHLCLVEDRLA